MSHYFENDKDLKSEIKKLTYKIHDEEFTFFTDNGVFSKTGIDFGSRLLLESIPLDFQNKKILDVGCGYGTLGIVLGKLTNSKVVMVDVNKRALHLTRLNIKENNCLDIEALESTCYQNITDKYDIIITNPPIRAGKKIVYEILMGAKKHLLDSGILYFVVRKDQGAKSIISDLSKMYNLTIINKKKGFFIIKAENG